MLVPIPVAMLATVLLSSIALYNQSARDVPDPPPLDQELADRLTQLRRTAP